MDSLTQSAPKTLRTKEKILTIATSMFSKHGFGSTSFRNIAEIAKINHAVISYHFGNKFELWVAVVDKLFDDLQKLDGNLDTSNLYSNKREVLSRYIESYVSYFSNKPFLLRIILKEINDGSDLIERIKPKIIAFNKKLLEQLEQLQSAGIANQIPLVDFHFILTGAVTFRFLNPLDQELKSGLPINHAGIIESHSSSIVNLLLPS